jgi:hypothetical protein
VTCKSICNRYAVKGIAVRDWNTDPNLMRCSTCGEVFHRKDWVISEKFKIKCICCGHLLSGKSGGKVAREKRWNDFLERTRELEFPAIIVLTDHKASYVKHLILSYMDIRFHTYDMIEIAGLSMRQWKHRAYPVPDGYVITNKRYGFIFAKIPREVLLKNKITSKLSIKI